MFDLLELYTVLVLLCILLVYGYGYGWYNHYPKIQVLYSWEKISNKSG